MAVPTSTPSAMRAFEYVGTRREQQFLLIPTKRDRNLARFRPSERCETAAAHVKGRKRSVPAFRRFRKRKYESSEIIIGHAGLSRSDAPVADGRG